MIYASKQFRMLISEGFKRDDVENALRNNNMNLEEAYSAYCSRASRVSHCVSHVTNDVRYLQANSVRTRPETRLTWTAK